MDVAEQLEELEKRVNQLEKENKELREKLRQEKEPEKDEQENKEISRRQFLKKAGLGTASLAAMSLIPSASAINVKSSEGLKVYQEGEKYLDITSTGVQITDTDLKVQNTTGQEVIQIPVYQSTSDLPSKGEGSIAYVKNDNKLYVQDSS